MAWVQADGITFAYEEAGTADAPVLLMIHGLGAQLIRRPPVLCDGLVDALFVSTIAANCARAVKDTG